MKFDSKISQIATLVLFLFSTPLIGYSRYGVLGGVNMASMASEPDDSFTSLSAIAFGGYYEFFVAPTVGLSSEFLLIGKGGNRGSDSVKIIINYFEVPLFLKFHLASRGVGLYIFGGPSLGFVLSSSGMLEDGSELTLSNLYPNEMGAQIGGGGEIPITRSMRFTFNIRYALGLNDISSAANNYKTKGIYILAGLTFPMGREDEFTDAEERAKDYLHDKYNGESTDRNDQRGGEPVELMEPSPGQRR